MSAINLSRFEDKTMRQELKDSGALCVLLIIGVGGCGSGDVEALVTAAAQTGTPTDHAEADPSASSVLGVHLPRSIQPAVRIADATFIAHAYRLLLARPYDRAGMRHHLQLLESGALKRADLVQSFVHSAEFAARNLGDRQAFVRRLYEQLLQRAPRPDELDVWLKQLRSATGEGSGLSWYEAYRAFIRAPEFALKNCHDRYYDYVQPLAAGQPTLADVFSGDAAFEPIAESSPVELHFKTRLAGVWGQKLAVFADPATDTLHAFTRGYLDDDRFNIFLLRSDDGLSFSQVGNTPVFPDEPGRTLYDPHIAIDYSVCPKRYVMTMECAWPGIGASLCVSYSTDPAIPEAWSRPQLVVQSGPGLLSASTGAMLFDGPRKLISWTVVDDGELMHDEGYERTYTEALSVSSYERQVARSAPDGQTILGAEPNVHCTDSWDCNNRDLQDWKREGEHYYAVYNGANYFRCVRSEGQSGTSAWGLALRRASTPLSTYRDSSGLLIPAERHDNCAISYPVVYAHEGALYMYYTYFPASGGDRTMRSRLVWQSHGGVETTPFVRRTCDLGSLRSDHSNTGAVRYAYCLLLARDAEPAGLNHGRQKLDDGTLSRKELLRWLFDSAEFQTRHGRHDRIDDTDFFVLLYNLLLERGPEASALRNGVAALRAGTSRGALFDWIIQRPEFNSRHPSLR
jgi:hypothetical protein